MKKRKYAVNQFFLRGTSCYIAARTQKSTFLWQNFFGAPCSEKQGKQVRFLPAWIDAGNRLDLAFSRKHWQKRASGIHW